MTHGSAVLPSSPRVSESLLLEVLQEPSPVLPLGLQIHVLEGLDHHFRASRLVAVPRDRSTIVPRGVVAVVCREVVSVARREDVSVVLREDIWIILQEVALVDLRKVYLADPPKAFLFVG